MIVRNLFSWVDVSAQHRTLVKEDGFLQPIQLRLHCYGIFLVWVLSVVVIAAASGSAVSTTDRTILASAASVHHENHHHNLEPAPELPDRRLDAQSQLYQQYHRQKTRPKSFSSKTASSPWRTASFSFSWRDGVGLALAVVGLVLAAGGGIGGGGILVPIFILIMRFHPKHAIPLSNVTVFGGALANLALNVRKYHPTAAMMTTTTSSSSCPRRRPLIDWDLILIMEPLTLTGAMVGANLNKILPDLVITIFLVLLFIVTARKTFSKAMTMYRQESQIAASSRSDWAPVKSDNNEDTVHQEDLNLDRDHDLGDPAEKDDQATAALELATITTGYRHHRHLERVEDRNENTENGLQPAQGTISTVKQPHSPDTTARTSSTLELEGNEAENWKDDDEVTFLKIPNDVYDENVILSQILEEECRPQMQSIAMLVLLFLFVLVVNILKGGGGFASPVGIQCGSAAFWLSEVMIIVATIVVTLKARAMLLEKSTLKRSVGYPYTEHDIRWDEWSTLVYPALCTLAGIVAGLCGIGGGPIKAPLMLALGVHPAVATATSATMILFTTFTATTSYLVFGLLLFDYAIICSIIGIVATFVGQTIMDRIVKRTNRSSYISFCIGLAVFVSAICLTAESLTRIIHGDARSSRELCSTAVD